MIALRGSAAYQRVWTAIAKPSRHRCPSWVMSDKTQSEQNEFEVPLIADIGQVVRHFRDRPTAAVSRCSKKPFERPIRSLARMDASANRFISRP